MDQTSLADKMPIDLVSTIDTLDMLSKSAKTVKLKLLCAWKHISEKQHSALESEAVQEFIKILIPAHKKLWALNQTLLDWYKNEINNVAKQQLHDSLNAYMTDSQFRSIKNSIWGGRLITDIKLPKAQKKATIKETVSSELTPLVSYNAKHLSFEEQTPEELKNGPFKQVQLEAEKKSLKILRIFSSTPKKSIAIVESDKLNPVEDQHISTDIQRKEVCYLRSKDKDWVLYYVPPTEFDKDMPKAVEYKIPKAAHRGFARVGEHGPVAVFECVADSSKSEVRIMRLIQREDEKNDQIVWGENLNVAQARELVAFEYRRKHGVILLRDPTTNTSKETGFKYSVVIFNDKNGQTLDFKTSGYFDCDLFEKPCSDIHLNTHVYFKQNGLPFPYFVHVFQKFVLVNYYSNNRGAAYVSIRTQKLDIVEGNNITDASWCWTKSNEDRSEAVERLLLTMINGTTKTDRYVKF